MLRVLFALFACTSLVGAVGAQDLPGPKIDWPDVKGLERQKPNVFKDKSLGYSVGYAGGDLVLTVFVYNLDIEKIPDGPYSDTVKAEMYESVLALEERKTGKKPRYKSLQPLGEAVIPFGSNKGAPQLRRKRYEVNIIDEGESITEMYLTGYKNYFLKIRATYPVGSKEKSEKAVDALLEALGKKLK